MSMIEYEDDEPADDVWAAFETGVQSITTRPPISLADTRRVVIKDCHFIAR